MAGRAVMACGSLLLRDQLLIRLPYGEESILAALNNS